GTPDVPRARCLAVPDPCSAMYRSVMLLHPSTTRGSFLSPQAIVASTANVDKSAYVGAFVTIGNGTTVGERAVIREGVRIGEKVHVGCGTVIEENAVIHDRVRLGNRVRIGSGTVIGSVGFGFVAVEGQQKRFPHVGTVVIEDDVEIGANCTVDRGTLGATRIARGSKLDNLSTSDTTCKSEKESSWRLSAGFRAAHTSGTACKWEDRPAWPDTFLSPRAPA
ncbi:MAG TPA: DapH/DapD/GlmU-related protein, partial [Candidatus Latescibacteria bacterium]|nr:DapH/DapD/GlmU-related protein [Candidatus Latescibacterota bacterium]